MRTESLTRVAVIGAGGMANAVHYPSLASFEDVRIVAACDLDQPRLNATADRHEIVGRYADYRKMIEETAPDAVYAIGPPHHFYDIWTWCLRHGLHLYIEKPLGITLHQARSLAHLAQENGCITQVSFQRRACPLVVLLRQECLKRGPMTHATCEFYKCATEPHLSAYDHMMDDGVHALDTLRWMCGGEVEEIRSIARRVLVPDLNFFSVMLQFDTGATGIMLTSWTSGRRIFRVQMHAPGICAEAEHEGKGTVYADGDTAGKSYDTREVAGSDQSFIYGGFQAKSREFIDAVKQRSLPSSHFGDALKTMELADRVLADATARGA
ncbi:MAG: Gfo/Idh/MocA family oxidoreductase [Chloroflexi bacterium]|nr:Gfo/Idh/MocA family oxidoreductase [Chloroflexota bacterium]